ncbi:MAG: hypothetical protein Q4D29_02960 [Lachnospiraceae bacterium]|nr:hypothetical protein [Lachnospiraceae bacterium]
MYNLFLKIVIALVSSIYYIVRFKRYIDNRKNNNVTGDVLLRWESVSLIDKYHIRERFLGGSKLRIKRDAKRHEIKYYWITFIPAVLFIYMSTKANDIYTYAISNVVLLFAIKVLFDRIEKASVVNLIAGFAGMILSMIGFCIVSAKFFSLIKISDIYRKFMISGKDLCIKPGIYIPTIVIIGVIIISLIKKRITSLLICLGTILVTVISVGVDGFPSDDNYLLIYYIGYLYVSLVVMQYIYNIRALKKITFIN